MLCKKRSTPEGRRRLEGALPTLTCNVAPKEMSEKKMNKQQARQAGRQGGGGRRIRNAANFACFSYLSWRAHSRHKQSDSSNAGNPGKRCCSPGKRVKGCVRVCVCANYLERRVSGYLAGSDCDYGYSRVLKYLCCLIYVLPALSLSIFVSLCV